jgi:oxaloacetate decarboxylase alpha subunit
MPNTPLGFLTTGKRFITWHRTPDTLLELAFELLARNGISRFWVTEPMVNARDAMEIAAMVKRVGGAEVVCGLSYSVSPVHTDEFYAKAAAALDACKDVDAVYLKDAGGLLTPERLVTLVPAIQGSLTRIPLSEVHSHCNTGLSPRNALDAVDLGIRTVHCAVDPAANGTSHPSVRQTIRNLQARGHTVDLDLDALGEVEHILGEYVADKGLPVGRPLEYEEDYYRHQLPGGMVSTLARQLQEIGREELLPAIKEEVVRVRQEFGYPIMITPFSQFMATQAMLNVLSAERYEMVTDEVIYLFLGDFGRPPGAVDPDVRDRVMDEARKRGSSIDRPEPTRAELRGRYGHQRSDEELLLSALLSPEEVDAAWSAPRSTVGVGPRPADAVEPSLRQLLTELKARRDISLFSFSRPGLRLELRR